ncbi:MAG: FtsQ-type POTRA domain-containing protein [Deltaproteobacteria bacterium]|nr:FtsQ-type POTRA domain-containing protein [Deltaproteobacteria bacterium]
MSRFRRPKNDRSSKRPTLAPNKRRGKSTKDESKKSRKSLKIEAGAGKRALGVILRIIATAAIAGVTVWAGLASYRHATTSEYFAVTEIKVSGTKRLGEVEVMKTAELSFGMNIFHVDTARAKSALEEHAWIAAAKVSRRLPRNVQVDIVERIAEAAVLFDVPYLVDDTGEVFKRWSRGDPIPSPIITGFSREQFIEDAQAVKETVRDAIDLARRYRSSGLSRTAPLAEIHYEVDGDLSLATSGDPFYVRFGGGPYRKKLTRLATLLGRLRRDGHRPAIIYFDNEVRPDRVTVKLKTQAKSDETETAKSVNNENNQKRMSKI